MRRITSFKRALLDPSMILQITFRILRTVRDQIKRMQLLKEYEI